MTPQTRINRQDLKIYPSERLTDNEDGGGMPLGHPLTGKVNELFNPISSIARVNGAFYARLEYAGVLRADDAPLIGAFMAITKPPKDDSVSYLLFKATRFGESRAEILKRIEAFNVGTIESRMTLMSTQSANSKIVQAYQTVGEPLPVVGDVFCLRQDKTGYPFAEQYIQVTRLSSEEREFVDKNGKKFKKTVVKLEISSKLEADFIGVDYPEEIHVNNPCKIRETNVADAAQYYGVKPLAVAIEKEVSKIHITGLMEKLVPTNQISTKLLDLTAAGQRQTLFDGSCTGPGGLVSLAVNKNHTAGQITSLYFGNAVTPNSVNLANSTGAITDKGGTLYANGTAVGSIDYARGLAYLSEPTFSGFLTTLTFRPAAAELKVADTRRINVDINNRSDSYTFNINPPPAVGTLMVSYRSQGRWYDLTDDGSGALRGASVQHGSGSINFITGTGSISTGELPDVGSAILLSFGTRANYFNRGGGTTVAQIPLNLNQKAVAGSITLTVTDDNGQTQTAQANRQGIISGAFNGQYDALNQCITLNKINAKVSGRPVVNVSYYTSSHASDVTRLPTVNGSQVTFSIEGMTKGAWQFTWGAQAANGVFAGWYTYYDDGLGHLIDTQNNIVGDVNYTAKTATFNSALPYISTVPVYTPSTVNGETRQVVTGYKTINGVTSLFMVNGVLGQFNVSGAVPDGDLQVQAFDLGGLQLDLLPDFNETVMPSSVNFILNGKQYFDKQGQIFTDLDPKTGAAQLAGTIHYQTGLVNLTDGQLGSLGTVTLVSLVTGIDSNPVDAVTFRTPQSPIRPGSLQIRATAMDGTLIMARAAYNRFNTWATLMAVWVLCAVQPSSTVTKIEDGFSQCLFGDTTEV